MPKTCAYYAYPPEMECDSPAIPGSKFCQPHAEAAARRELLNAEAGRLAEIERLRVASEPPPARGGFWDRTPRPRHFRTDAEWTAVTLGESRDV